MSGGLLAVAAGSTADDLLVQDNSIGTNAARTGVLDGASSAAIFVNSGAAAPATISDNLVVEDAGATPIAIGNTGVTVSGNEIGMPGTAGSGGSEGITAEGGSFTISDNVISETTDEAIFLSDASATEVTGNSIGESGPVGDGITITHNAGSSLSNTIGGAAKADANKFGDVAGNAIEIRGDGQDGNQILTNLGGPVGGLFVDLRGTDGPGNGAAGLNAGIEAPKVKKVKEDEVTGTGVPHAEVWIYRSRSGKGEVPQGLKKFLGTKSVKGDGSWKFKPDSKVKGKHVITALQIDGAGNSSELAKGKQPK